MSQSISRYLAFAALTLVLSSSSTLVPAAEPVAPLIRPHAQWKYFAEKTEPPANWNQASFDDDAWKSCRWPERLRAQIEEYNILDFSAWKDEKAFEQQWSNLVDGLKLFY